MMMMVLMMIMMVMMMLLMAGLMWSSTLIFFLKIGLRLGVTFQHKDANLSLEWCYLSQKNEEKSYHSIFIMIDGRAFTCARRTVNNLRKKNLKFSFLLFM